MRALILIGCAATLSGCTLFYPRFDPVVFDKTDQAYGEVTKLTSAAELGKYDTSATYKDAIDQYADIDSKLAVASLRVLTSAAPTRLSQAARSGVRDQIEQCRKQVKLLAGVHKDSGIPSGAGAIQPVVNSCDQAARAAEAMK